MSTSSFCPQSNISTTRCQSGPCDLVPVSSYVWPASSSSQPKVGQSRSIRVLYTLWLELSLLGHERVLVEEAHSVQLSGMKRKSFFMCVFGVYDTTPIHRWRAIRADKKQTMMNSFGVPIACHDSFHSTPLTDQRTDWLRESETDRWLRDMVIFPGEGAVERFVECFAVLLVPFDGGQDHLWVRRDVEDRREGMERSRRGKKTKTRRDGDETHQHLIAFILFYTAWCKSVWSYAMYPTESVT